MSNIPTLTYVLDVAGGIGVLVGGYVASKSTYATKTSKQAALLIDTQSKRIDYLMQESQSHHDAAEKMKSDISLLQGQVKTFKELQLISPDIIKQLLETQTSILAFLTAPKTQRGKS